MTLALPRHLTPWRQPLELFPQDLAVTLGAWIPRLAAAVGPLAAATSTDGEPDGFAGLARRGPYERLLHSEWLLLDHAPDEFVRRAVDGEHAFVELSRRQPRAARRTVAVFDAGPDQIGAPRLAHLAALIVFAQRAQAASAELLWGLAHEPNKVHDSVTAQSVLALVQGRTARLTDADQLQSWLDRATGEDDDDLWLVGHRLADLARRTSHASFSSLVAHDVLALDRTAIEVRIARRRRPAVHFELPLPEKRAAARLLRDPFEVKSAAPSEDASASDAVPATLAFAMGGDRLLARRRDGSVVAWHVPNQPSQRAGRPRELRTNDWQPPFPLEAILAVEHARRRRTVFATLWGTELVWQRGDRRQRFRVPTELLHAAKPLLSGEPDAPLWRLARLSESTRYLLCAPGGPAFLFDPRSDGRPGMSPREIDSVIEDVAAVAWHDGAPLQIWKRAGDGLTGFRLQSDGSLHRSTAAQLPGNEVRASLGWVAACATGSVWCVHNTHDRRRVETRLPESARVLGLTNEGELVTVDRVTVRLCRGNSRRTVYKAQEPVAGAALSAKGDRVGVMTPGGTVRVIDLASGRTLVWFTPGARL